MVLSSLFASLHYLALALGLGGVYMRGSYLRQLLETQDREASFKALFRADTAWGIAALLWIITGLMRAFGGLEKGADYYLHQPLFWVKMGLFLLVFALEIYPMATYLVWRRKLPSIEVLARRQPRLLAINQLELFFVIVIPFVASLMARGIGL